MGPRPRTRVDRHSNRARRHARLGVHGCPGDRRPGQNPPRAPNLIGQAPTPGARVPLRGSVPSSPYDVRGTYAHTRPGERRLAWVPRVVSSTPEFDASYDSRDYKHRQGSEAGGVTHDRLADDLLKNEP